MRVLVWPTTLDPYRPYVPLSSLMLAVTIGGFALVAYPARWGDPYKAFVGDVNGYEPDFTGYGVYYPPIVAAPAAGD